MRKLSLVTDQISKRISGTPTWRPTLSVVPENLFAYYHHIYRKIEHWIGQRGAGSQRMEEPHQRERGVYKTVKITGDAERRS